MLLVNVKWREAKKLQIILLLMSHLKVFRFVLSVVKGNRYTEVSSSAITFNAFPVSIRGFKTKWKNYLFYLFSFILLFFKRCGRQLSCFRRCTTHPTCPADESEFMVVVDLTRFFLFFTWQGFFFFLTWQGFFFFLAWQGFFFFAPHTSHFTGIRFSGTSKRWWSAWEGSSRKERSRDGLVHLKIQSRKTTKKNVNYIMISLLEHWSDKWSSWKRGNRNGGRGGKQPRSTLQQNFLTKHAHIYTF